MHDAVDASTVLALHWSPCQPWTRPAGLLPRRAGLGVGGVILVPVAGWSVERNAASAGELKLDEGDVLCTRLPRTDLC